MAHSSAGCTACVSSLLSGTLAAGHLLNLSLVLEVSVVIFVKVRLGDDGFLVKETFCKCMILTFDPLSLSLAHAQI